MTDKEITICGHGSGNPSLKNLNSYSTNRYNQLASNGKHKGIIEVRRLKALTDDKRPEFSAKYKTIIGRNFYNQNLRDYVYSPYKDGRYYSDCSSSGCATYRAIGYSVSNLNTAGIHTSKLFETVPVKIQNGHITNPEILKVGDAILFVGNDPERPLQIGHVEFVYAVPAVTVAPKEYTVGWNHDEHGWWYATSKTEYVKDRWVLINHHKYYFNANGYAVTGWQKIGDSWYFFENTPGHDYECALYLTDSDGRQKVGYF